MKRKQILFALLSVSISVVLSLFIAEILLRVQGYPAGVLVSGFEPVEHIEDRFCGYADSLGIQHVTDCVFQIENIHPKNYINTDGFRSPEFSADSSNDLSILFLGDSHTWGGSAMPLFNCFVDRSALKVMYVITQE